MIDISKLTPEQLERFLHMQAIVDRQREAQDRVRALRDYYAGEHPVLLTQRQQEFLGSLVTEGNFVFRHNLLKSIVDTVRERLDVLGFTVNGKSADDLPEDGDTEADLDNDAQIAALFWQWWNENRMDSGQIELYRNALVDGTSYVFVDYDNENQRPRLTVHKADDGTTGVTFHRDPSDADKVLFANRYFYTYNPLEPGQTGLARKTTYLPGEIRKYIADSSAPNGWKPYMDEGDMSWPLPWKDAAGNPLGVPVFEFANPGGSEIAQIVGMQNALNKSWLDLIAAADSSGFPVTVIEYEGEQAFGNIEDDDEDLEGDDEIRIAPGRAIEVDNARVHRLEPANLLNMIAVIWTIVEAISGLTRIPQYYLRPLQGADMPSGEALKQMESGLVKRAEERQLLFGQAWVDVFTMCYKVAATFGTLPVEAEQLNIRTLWVDPNTRIEKSEAEVAQIHKALGVPDDAVWSRLGYTPEQIAEFRSRIRTERLQEIASIAMALRNNQQNGDNDERTNQTR